MLDATGGETKKLGFLIAWLRDGIFWDSLESHFDGRLTFKREERTEARRWAHVQPHSAALVEQEKWSDKHAGFDAAGNIEEPLTID